MKVVHICTSLEGGAGLCASRIIKATTELGIDNRVLVANGIKNENVDIIKPYYPWSKIWLIQKYQVLRNLFSKWPKADVVKAKINEELKINHGTFTSPITNYTKIIYHPWINEADIVHLHWIGNFIDYESFFSNINKPIVWTIHDQNPGLGGFHLTSWKEEATNSFKLLDDEMMKVKEKAYSYVSNMTLVAISSEMCQYFDNNQLLKRFPYKKIHNGIEKNSFVALEKEKCREILGIPLNTKVFIFVSQDIHDSNKRLDVLIKALEAIDSSNIMLICLGGYRYIPKASFEIRCEGFVGNNRLQSIYYSAADYFVMTSLQETFAQSPMEAMACGTPVIICPFSGARDLVNQDNGVVSDDFAADSFVKAIKIAMSTKYNRDKIRMDVLSRFSYDSIAKQYIELYNSKLKDNK